MSTATTNRITPYIDQPAPTPSYGTIVSAALQTMVRLMNSPDNAVAFNAASAVLELEKARLRHKTPLAGVDDSVQHREAHVEQEVEPTTTSPDVRGEVESSAAMNRVGVMHPIESNTSPDPPATFSTETDETARHEWCGHSHSMVAGGLLLMS
jgi:hypothetical protein